MLGLGASGSTITLEEVSLNFSIFISCVVKEPRLNSREQIRGGVKKESAFGDLTGRCDFFSPKSAISCNKTHVVKHSQPCCACAEYVVRVQCVCEPDNGTGVGIICL